MQDSGRIKSISQDITSGKICVLIELDTKPIEELNRIGDEKVIISIGKVQKKRSLDANAYFHLLVGKIADILRISKPRCKNELLGRYGQREGISISVRGDIDMLEREDIHVIPTGYQQVYGQEYVTYDVIRPSHTYNTEEMATLIAGTVDEAKDLGIETMTPDELARINHLWEAK